MQQPQPPPTTRVLMLLMLLLPCAAAFVVQRPFTQQHRGSLTRRHFKVPTEPIPIVDTLEKKGNLSWTLPGACRACVCVRVRGGKCVSLGARGVD
jgi:hypothetical protein